MPGISLTNTALLCTYPCIIDFLIDIREEKGPPFHPMNQLRYPTSLGQSPVKAHPDLLHRILSFLGRIFVDIPKVFGWWSGGVIAGILILLFVREFWRARRLLRRMRWRWPSLVVLHPFLLGVPTLSLYKVTRLRIEWELLNPPDPPPNRINFEDVQDYREEAVTWSKERRKWKQDRNSQLRRLVRSGESTERIEITNCTPLIDNADIELYFDVLATQHWPWDRLINRGRRFSDWWSQRGFPGQQRLSNYFAGRGSDGLSGEEPIFLSKIEIGSGFLAPLHLLTGLLVRYHENWEKIGKEYGRSVIRDDDPFRYEKIRRNQASILSLWLVWGPSIPVCTCREWQGNVLLQYGVVDEDNSISVRFSSPEKILAKLDRPDPEQPPGLAFAASITGTLRWGPLLRPRKAICPAQRAIWDDDRLVLDAADGKVEPAGGDSGEVYATLYSAYLWIAFAMCKAETDEPFHPKAKWRDLIPFFEHANIADGDTYDFHTGQLACAAVEGALRFLRLDSGLQLRFVCAVDESGCGSKLRYSAGTTKTIRNKMIEFTSTSAGLGYDRDPAMQRLLLDFDHEQPWKDGDYSACALPDILSDYYDATEHEDATEREVTTP
jgi:hypothetical protein